ncbi:DUF2079 domain-containing protein [Candidatus Gottesmanbacteria bacterium]|nr:DUF2079 domain-containing protein [Candidatus Gottesmanbacteria bacterium]
MKHRYIGIVVYICVAIYTLAAILVSLHRFWQFEVFYYDFGIFDQAIWHVSRFLPPVIDHFVIPGKIIFADHFSPSIFLLTPIYWLTDRPEALLILQAAAVGLSALVLYKLSERLIKYPFVSGAVTCAYLLFVGTQNALIADIHEVTFMMLPLMLTLYAVTVKNKKMFWVTFLITLGFKESSALLGVALAIYIYFHNKTWKNTAIITAIISVVWGYTATQIIIPYFYGRPYFYTPHFDSNPLTVLSTLIDDPIKQKTLLWSFASFGFLPVLHPLSWPLILQDLATRFMQGDFSLRWGLGLHYSAQMAVILAFSSVRTLKNLQNKNRNTIILPANGILLISGSLILHRFILRGPLGLAYNPAFYQNTKNFRFLNDLIARVPKGATVMTMNNIAPHMIHTHKVYLIRGVYEDFMPEYFLLDLREGQNFNNFFGADIEAVKLTLPNDTRYSVYYQNGDQIIYKRNN